MSFDNFWKLYPRKVSKRMAQKVWERMPKDEQEAATDALPNHIRYWQLKETDPEFIPHATTWLNQGRWEDELDMAEKKPPALPWYSDEQLTMQKAREVDIMPMPGESFSDLRKRIAAKLRVGV